MQTRVVTAKIIGLGVLYRFDHRLRNEMVHIYAPFRFGQHACKVAKQMGIAVTAGYDIGTTLATIMMNIINDEEIAEDEGILHHEEQVDLLPANIELSALEVTMSNVMSRELIMKEYIDTMRLRYDYILIDCMPSLGMMTINALVV